MEQIFPVGPLGGYVANYRDPAVHVVGRNGFRGGGGRCPDRSRVEFYRIARTARHTSRWSTTVSDWARICNLTSMNWDALPNGNNWAQARMCWGWSPETVIRSHRPNCAKQDSLNGWNRDKNAVFMLSSAYWNKHISPANALAGGTAFAMLGTEGEGFEPPWACTQTVFKTAAL